MRITNPGVTTIVTQATASNLNVAPEHLDRTPHYVELPHGVLTDIWDPAAGYRIHATSITVSVEGAGHLTLQHGATVFATMHFNTKNTVPFHSGGDITLPTDAVLKGTFTADNATDSGYVTAFDHEHL